MRQKIQTFLNKSSPKINTKIKNNCYNARFKNSKSKVATMANEQKTVVKMSSGSSGLFGLILALIFGPLGVFISYWLIAKNSLIRSIIYGVVWFIVLAICAVSMYIIIGFVLLPIAYIVMLVMTYKACSAQEVEIFQTTTTESNQAQ